MVTRSLYDVLTEPGTQAEQGEERRFAVHLFSLISTKTADGLIDPKLVLSWLLSTLSAPGFLIGALVPVREAGALLPQLLLARRIEASPLRKMFWASGSIIQGFAALCIAGAAFFLDGAAAGWAIVVSLAVLSVARAACSASYKDVLARTVSKGARGTVSGTAGSVAAIAVLAFAALLGLGVIPRTTTAIAAAIAVAGVLWIGAGLLFARLDETAVDDTSPDGFGLDDLTGILKADAELRVYLATRALLISTALAPPFLVMLSNREGAAEAGNLGLFLIASSAATILSSYVWGRVSDRSSRKTLVIAGALAAVCFSIAAVHGFTSGNLGGPILAAMFIFSAQVAYEAARAGRKTHLTDMDTQGQKSLYTALSNSLIGPLLLAGGLFGLLADVTGPQAVLAAFALMAALAVPVGMSLSEVQDDA